jgi:phage tail-like protein
MTAMPRQDTVLVVEFQGDIVRTIPLTFTALRIGRAPDNELYLQHPGISRHHVELSIGTSGLVATDLDSANGTFLDGVQLLPNQPTRLEVGQVLQIGPYIFALRRSPAERPDGVTPVPSSEPDGALRRVIVQTDQFVNVVPTYPRRPTLPAPAPSGFVSKYLDYLPPVFAENDFLGRYLLIFESIWEALEQRQDHIAMYFDPRTCPESLLPWLAAWFDLKTGFHWPEARTRDLVEQVSDLYRYRGTAYGLTKMLEIWTGATPDITEDPNEPFVFHVRMKAPPGGQIDRAIVEQLLNDHKPAAVGFTLELEG